MGIYEKSPSTFNFFENKLAEHTYMADCGVPHVPVLGSGFFNASHGNLFDMKLTDRPLPFIARFATEGASQGTFKVDDEESLKKVKRAIRRYRKTIYRTHTNSWGLKSPREGVLLSE